MRYVKRIGLVLLAVIVIAVLALLITGNGHVLRGIGKTYLIGKTKPDIDDMKYFDVREIKTTHPEPWPIHPTYNNYTLTSDEIHFLDSMETVGFILIQNDSLLFEQYWRDFNAQTPSNSFSMAKSFTALLVGIAIEEGYIKGVDQKVSEFIPEFSDGKNAELSIKHLLQMCSGIPFGESYNSPFGYMARAYYGTELTEETLKFKVEKDPGSFWIYEGGNTVLLSMVLQKATGKSISKYFEEKIWTCIGAEQSAYWNLDKKDGLEKAYSGVYATPRDYARIGNLFLHKGVWRNDTLVPSTFVEESLIPSMVKDAQGEPCNWYGYHWWLGEYNSYELFSCRGLRGQYIVTIPELNLVMVRTGHEQMKERKDHMPIDMYRYLDIAMRICEAGE